MTDTSRPLRRTRGDLIATGVITAICVITLLVAYFTAPIRKDHLTPAAQEVPDGGMLAVVPSSPTEAFTLTDTSPGPRPVIVSGQIITYADNTISASTPDGQVQWTYERGPDLCAMTASWDEVIAVYRTKIGCGDVVAITAATGDYSNTRSSIAPDEIAVLTSNDRVGTLGAKRAELWRSDLVRTVEYGEEEAPQEPDMQPHPGCELTSALTRAELFAVTEKCSDGTWLRFQKATPEDSRKPEMHESVQLSDGAYLVAVSQDAAAVHDPTTSQVTSYNQEGQQVAQAQVPQSNLLADSPTGFVAVQTADLPHHMSYYDGANVILLDASTLKATTNYENALGTGVVIDDRLLFPVADGIAVVDWDEKRVEKVIPVDRQGYTGPVALDSAGPTIVEKRGENVVVLDAQ